jgi:hypothetical protein
VNARFISVPFIALLASCAAQAPVFRSQVAREPDAFTAKGPTSPGLR